MEFILLILVWDMVLDVGILFSMVLVVVRVFDLVLVEIVFRRVLERFLEFFLRKVNIWKRVILGK